jgi:hypothetical protein
MKKPAGEGGLDWVNDAAALLTDDALAFEQAHDADHRFGPAEGPCAPRHDPGRGLDE